MAVSPLASRMILQPAAALPRSRARCRIDLARGLGVEGMRVATPGELRPALDKALAAGRPFLLDVAIEGRA